MRNLGRWLSEHKWSVALAAIVSVGAAVVATFEYFGEFNSASDESASGPIDSIDSMPPATYAPTPDYRESFPESEMRLNDSGEGLLSLVPGIYDVYNFESGTYQQIILNPPNIRIWDPYTGAEILTGVIDPETNIVTDSQGQQFRLSDLSDGFDVFRRDSQPDITASAAPEAAPPPAAMITQADSEREAQAEQIREYFDQLEEGDFFHNVPEEMQVNVETVIEAGIAKEATNLVLERLGLEEEDVTLRTDAVRYDPLGTEVILWADEDAFEVTPIKGGQQTVFVEDQQIGCWRV